MRHSSLILAAAFMSLSTLAYAQGTVNGNPANFDQYPSFIEMTTASNGSEILLRCGYSSNGVNIMPDPAFMESAVQNSANSSYARFQRIDNKILITAPAPGSPGRFVVQVTEPNGNVIAKSCMFNGASDTLQNCLAAQPFVPAVETARQDQGVAQQCGDFLAKATPQLDAHVYDLRKTEIFKNALRQKIAIVEAP
jgi:hypothetical protein